MSRVQRSVAVMGTRVRFDVRSAPAQLAADAVDDAVDWLRAVDARFSPFRPDSEVSRVAVGELTVADAHPDVRHILELGEVLRDRTDGYFDAWVTGGWDPCGVVKGWAVERASRLLTEAGCPNHLVDGGGDVRLAGRPAPGADWLIGVTHPWQLDAYCAALRTGAGAVATSGSYRRGHHVIDPVRGRPADALAAVTVVGPELTAADAYATAALAMGERCPSWLAGLPEHEAMVVRRDGSCWQTPGFGGLLAG